MRAKPDPNDWPVRLREGNDDIALLLQGESERRLQSGRPFFEVAEKRARRQLRNRSLMVLGAAACAALWFASFVKPTASEIVAEAPSLTTEREHLPVFPLLPPEASNDRDLPANREPTSGVSVEAVSVQGASFSEVKAKQISREPSLNPTIRSDCGELSRRGDYIDALQCFRVKSEGQGTSAEIGFLEMARIQRGALDNWSAALTTLERYQSKFPHGTLSLEAERLKQELLRGNRGKSIRSDRVTE